MKTVTALIAAVLLLSGCQKRGTVKINGRVATPLVMRVLIKAHGSGSLEYWGRCDDAGIPNFPPSQPTQTSSASPSEALREIFAGDEKMRVVEEAGGMFRMVETDVPQDLLNVRISNISFKLWNGSDAVYTSEEALKVITSTREVQAYKQAHGIKPFGFEQPSDLHPISPSPTSPRISGDLHNVTVSQALDYVLRTFPGLWIYENCADNRGGRAVFFAFYENSPAWLHDDKPAPQP